MQRQKHKRNKFMKQRKSSRKIKTRKQNHEEKGLKILTPQQILCRLPIFSSLVKLKARNNSQKLKNA